MLTAAMTEAKAADLFMDNPSVISSKSGTANTRRAPSLRSPLYG
jgi:hypothetical protein